MQEKVFYQSVHDLFAIATTVHPASIYSFKVNKENNKRMCDTFSKPKIKTPERHHWRRSDVFIVKFEKIH